MAAPRRILIVKLSAIGDCLHASPVAQALRQTFPDAFIGWAVHKHCAPVIRGNPHINRVHEWQRKGSWRSLLSLRDEMRSEKYDLSLDLQGLLKSGMIGLLSGAKERYGPSDAREKAPIFYNRKLPSHPELPVVAQYLAAATEIGARWDVEPPMYFPFGDSDRAAVTTLLGELGVEAGEVLVALNPSTSRHIKQWKPERFGQLADRLIDELGVRPVLTGAPADRDLCDVVLANSMRRERIVDTCGRLTLRELAALLERCKVFLGGDTGPMHMAQAVGSRVMALFGPTDPAVLGPRGPQHRVIYKHWECSPCRHRVCPIGDACLGAISVDEVFETLASMLSS